MGKGVGRGPSASVEAFAEHGGVERSFDLQRWFAIFSLLCIALISVISAMLLSKFLTETMLRRDAVVSKNFIESIALAENASAYFAKRMKKLANPVLENLFVRISHMPDITRTNVYARDKTVLWSSEPSLTGRRLGENEDLDEAFRGVLKVETGVVGVADKPEHITFGPGRDGTRYVENYIPLWNPERNVVIGVVELYKAPTALFRAVAEGRRQIWINAIVGGIFLYGTLFWIVRHASNIIHRQHKRLVESEMLAAIGEMASAVAHGIRNPLASIRSSAELVSETGAENAKESATDIINETDRLDKWVRDLLAYLRPAVATSEPVDANAVVRDALRDYGAVFETRDVSLMVELDAALPTVQANAAALVQVFVCLVDNALYAMQEGGKLSVATRVGDDRGHIEVRVTDTGTGLPQDFADQVFRPFVTTKHSGLGLGLALSRRIVERHGGKLDLANARPRGVVATICLPIGA